jgi:heme/copper-type cytochrome/quinol oxidase subunit 1
MGDNNTPEDRKTPKPARALAAVAPFIGLAAVLVGSIVAWNSSSNASFGWFAYAPLSNETFSGSGMAFVTQGTQVGLAVAVVGLLVLAFWAGHTIGRRTRSQNQ